jgi:hypothetical protein
MLLCFAIVEECVRYGAWNVVLLFLFMSAVVIVFAFIPL